MPVRLLPWLLCAMTALHAATSAVQAPVSLAIVRADGLLIPFASWDGRLWSNRWPVPVARVETPITLEDVPAAWWGPFPGDGWHVWLPDGTRERVRAARPSWYLAHCQQGVGLASTLVRQATAPPPVLQPYPKIGLAATVPLPFARIAMQSRESSVWAAIAPAIGERVAQIEEPQIARRLTAGWSRPADEGYRGRIDIEVEALYRAPLGDGRFLHYFEAVKRYGEIQAPRGEHDEPGRGERRLRPTPDCPLLTVATGWFVARTGDERITVPTLEVAVTECDYADIDVMLPLGSLPDDGGPVWIVQFSGWGRERFAILQWDGTVERPRVLLATHGGECPRVAAERLPL